MQLYLLYVSYPYEGGTVYGVFSSYEEADKHRNSDKYLSSSDYTHIQPITVDLLTEILV
ncbi:hypothetical protein MG295_00173 [Bacillus phage vB_BcgM]|nr:hypothetical protein MG295_00173 [Bacillus phage vB_BcgM]